MSLGEGGYTPPAPTSLPPSGAAGGDLGGTYPNPTVVQLTGAAGVVSVPAAALTWGNGVSPALGQLQSTTGVGHTTTHYAQQGKAGSVGGVLKIGGGAGGTPGTNLAGATQIDLGATVANVSAALSVLANGASILDINRPAANQTRIGAPDNTTNSATGAATTIQAQNATGTTATGGDLVLKSGTGTSQDGFIYLTQGSATPVKVGIQNLLGQANKTYIDFGASPGGLASSSQVISCAYGSGGHVYFFTNAGTCHFGQSTNLDALTITSNINFNTATVAYQSAVASPTFYQQDIATNGATGQPLTVHAQNATGTTSTGGNLILASGTGTSASGSVKLQAGSTTRVQANSTGIGFFAAAPVAQQAVTGPLSIVADPNAKTVLTSILAALSSYGLVTNATT